MRDNRTRQTLVQASVPGVEMDARRIAEMELIPGEELLWARRINLSPGSVGSAAVTA